VKPKSIVILISGSGSNLQAIIDAVQQKKINAEISAVISNRPDAAGLKKAQSAGIPAHTIDHTDFPDRQSFDTELLKLVSDIKPDLVVLAGFMRILSDEFIHQYTGHLINIHPSLLPAYKGLNTHRRVLADNGKKHGASVHFVSSELDSGSVVIQAEVPVFEDDTVELLASRVLEEEHIIYPQAIQWFIEGKLCLTDNRAYYEQHEIKQPAKWIDNILTEPQ